MSRENLSDAPHTPEFQYRALQLDYMGRTVPRVAPEGEAEMVQARIEDVRQQILDAFTSHEEGIDTERVDNYFARLGLKTVPHILIWPEEFVELEKMISSLNDVGMPNKEQDFEGMHIGNLGFCYVVRNREMEELQGPEYSEAVLVHEKAHSTNRHNLVTGTDRTYWITINQTPRTGFMIFKPGDLISAETRGSLFEEGYCERIRADYMASEMDLPYGFAREPGTFPVYGDAPVKYSLMREDGPDLYPSSIAGYAVDLLCDYDPDIWPLMLEARSETAGLRSFAKHIEAIRPGLYGTLAKKAYTQEEFLEGVKIIKAVIGET